MFKFYEVTEKTLQRLKTKILLKGIRNRVLAAMPWWRKLLYLVSKVLIVFQVMQFGRIDGNAYTLDFQYPFSVLQAFAVALANVTQRLK